jgi:hypothetical protein
MSKWYPNPDVPGPNLSVPEARRLIHDPELTHSGLKVFAAATLMHHCEHDFQITFDDMLRCLDYGGTIASMGARCLYVRTGRDRLGWEPADPSTWVVDRADWERYLRQHQYITRPNHPMQRSTKEQR